VLALCFTLGNPAFAREVIITVNGAELEGNAFVENGVTYAPLVPLLEAMGGWTATWEQSTATARSETDLFTLSVPTGQRQVNVDTYSFDLNAPSLVRDGRTYVPLRSVAGLLGGQVTFSGWHMPVAVTTTEGLSYTENDLYWLSRVISAESQGERLRGQIAVGNVVLNRVASRQFPNTIQSVIFDTKDAVQFEPTSNGTIYHIPTQQSLFAARLVLAGATVVDDCMYFFNPSLSQGMWIRQNCTYYTTIGCHRFYR